MFCPSCGKPLPPDSKFCPSCGHAVAAVTPGASAAPSAPAAPSFTAAAPAAAVPPIFDPPPAAAYAPETKRTFGARLRAMKTWKKVVLGVVLGIVIFIAAVVTLALSMTSGLREPVERHFAAIRAGDIVGAYSDLSIAARQQTSLDDFKAMLTNMPALTHVTGESFSSRTVTNGQGQLVGTLDLDGGGKLPIEIQLVKENDAWKILAYHVTSAKPPE